METNKKDKKKKPVYDESGNIIGYEDMFGGTASEQDAARSEALKRASMNKAAGGSAGTLHADAIRLKNLIEAKKALETTFSTVAQSGQRMVQQSGQKITDLGANVQKTFNEATAKLDKQIQESVRSFQSTPVGQAFIRQFAANVPEITQYFANSNAGMGYKNNIHAGTDFGAKRGTVVTLPKGNWQIIDAKTGYGDGRLGNFSDNQGYGNSVLALNKDTGEQVRLSHLQETNLQPGQEFKGGVVGTTGNSGNSTAEHLDVEYYGKDGKLGDVTKTGYVNSLFALNDEKPKVNSTPDKEGQDLKDAESQMKQNDVASAFANLFGKPANAAASQFTPVPTPSKPNVTSTPSNNTSGNRSVAQSSPSVVQSAVRATSSQTQSKPAATSYGAPTSASTYGGAARSTSSSSSSSSSQQSRPATSSYSAPKASPAPTPAPKAAPAPAKSAPAKSNPVSNIINAIKRWFGW